MKEALLLKTIAVADDIGVVQLRQKSGLLSDSRDIALETNDFETIAGFLTSVLDKISRTEAAFAKLSDHAVRCGDVDGRPSMGAMSDVKSERGAKFNHSPGTKSGILSECVGSLRRP
jgi:hypothetical protein